MSLGPTTRAVFKTKKANVPGVLARAQAMHDGISANPTLFASPPVAMAVFLVLITALAVAQQATLGTRARGAASLRDTKRNAVWTAMNSLQSFVQGLADVLDAAGAAALIEAAGMVVANIVTFQKALLTPSLTTTPGTVHLDANASLLVGRADAKKKVTFNWQWSEDGGSSWHNLPSTPYANTDVTGLPLMSMYTFRVSVTVGKVIGTWSQPVSLLVH